MAERLLPGVWITSNQRWQPADQALGSVADEPIYELDPDIADYDIPTDNGKNLPFPDWHRKANCVGAPEATFFGARDTTERPAVSMSDIARAKKICADCPVYQTCLATALGLEGENREEYGIWAGTSGRTRKRIWSLVDNDGQDLETIYDDILDGNLVKYERNIVLCPAPQIIPLRPVLIAAVA